MFPASGRRRARANVGVSDREEHWQLTLGDLSRWLPPIALIAIIVVAYAPYVSDFFVGADTWAHIWTSRDVGSVLTQPIMAGSAFPETVARFYRPISSLSYSVQYAAWGLNPLAFHVGDVVIHLLAMLGLYALIVVLGLRPWAAAVGAAVVALHPAMASVVPAAPRRHDSLVTIGLCVGLILVVRYVTSPRAIGRRQTLAAIGLSCLALVFAELAKEIGYIGLLLVLPALLAGCIGSGINPFGRSRPIGYVLLAWTATSVIMLVWHAHVVGGLGGYGPLSPFTDLDARVNELVQILLWPFRDRLETYLKAWLIELGLVLFVFAVPLVVIRRSAAATLAFGWVWLLVSGTFQLMSESTAPWQTYVTIVAFGFTVAAVLDGAAGPWKDSVAARIAPRQAGLAARAILAFCVAGVVVFAAAITRDSVLVTPYSQWHTAGNVARDYLTAIRSCVQAAPQGATVLLADWPSSVDDATDQYRLIMAGVFAPYSVGPAIYLTTSRTDVSFQTLKSELAVPALTRISASCGADGSAWRVQAVYDPPLAQPKR